MPALCNLLDHIQPEVFSEVTSAHDRLLGSFQGGKQTTHPQEIQSTTIRFLPFTLSQHRPLFAGSDVAANIAELNGDLACQHWHDQNEGNAHGSGNQAVFNRSGTVLVSTNFLNMIEPFELVAQPNIPPLLKSCRIRLSQRNRPWMDTNSSWKSVRFKISLVLLDLAAFNLICVQVGAGHTVPTAAE